MIKAIGKWYESFKERNKGAFVMSPHAGDIDRLLSKSSKLAGEVRDEEA